jgi:citrate lyase beta subunit
MMGFDGKLVLVPAQVRTVHEAYRPTEAELRYARTMLDKLERMNGGRRGTAAAPRSGRRIALVSAVEGRDRERLMRPGVADG